MLHNFPEIINAAATDGGTDASLHSIPRHFGLAPRSFGRSVGRRGDGAREERREWMCE